MKTVRTLLAGLIVGTALLSSCSKEDRAVDPVMNPAATPSVNSKTVAFETATMTRGSLYGSLYMKGSKSTILDMQEPTDLKLQSYMRDIGGDDVMGEYGDFELVFNTPKESMSKVLMTGYYIDENGTEIPVSFTINDRFTIHKTAMTAVIGKYTTLGQLMSIDLSKMTAGIDASYWDKAQVSEGMIRISEYENLDLYDELKRNFSELNEITWE